MGKSNKCLGFGSERMMLLIAMLSALLSLANATCSEPPHSAPKDREAYEISKKYETTSHSSDGSQGSSSGREAVLERVIAVQEGGMELEFDLPKEATAEDRARSWQFPVRVFRANDGVMRLLNRPELERRNDEWLKAAGLTRAACGQWIFTWNAFRIDCDPESAIELVEAFDLRSAGIREGASYQETEARSPGTLTRKSADPDGATFTVVMEIDPDAVRRGRAESDVAVGEMTQKPVTLDAALRERAKEDISGTISVTFETDAVGKIQRRTRVTSIETKRPDGESETQTLTETVERRSLPLPPAGR
jgi:hypothetical protein